jgi:hypothetical protein
LGIKYNTLNLKDKKIFKLIKLLLILRKYVTFIITGNAPGLYPTTETAREKRMKKRRLPRLGFDSLESFRAATAIQNDSNESNPRRGSLRFFIRFSLAVSVVGYSPGAFPVIINVTYLRKINNNLINLNIFLLWDWFFWNFNG